MYIIIYFGIKQWTKQAADGVNTTYYFMFVAFTAIYADYGYQEEPGDGTEKS